MHQLAVSPMNPQVRSSIRERVLLPVKSQSSEPADHPETIIDLSDEEVGTCGGIITLVHQKKPRVPAGLLLHWTTLKSIPTLRPNIKLKPTNLRPIVIDGSNVSYKNGLFYGSRLEICVESFINAGHDVRAFVPQFRSMHSLTREPEILDDLEDSGYLVFTPSRSIDNQRQTPYDDRFIVEYADLTGAVIVSNDRFSDLLRENESWEKTIRRRLSFCWHDQRIYFPRYPLGKEGPTLDDFLHSSV